MFLGSERSEEHPLPRRGATNWCIGLLLTAYSFRLYWYLSTTAPGLALLPRCLVAFSNKFN